MGTLYRDRVWQNKKLKGGRLLVMLALADYADDNGECYPGMPLLMEKTRLTDRQLRRVLNGLDDDGLISIEERAIGRGKHPHYKLFPQGKADISTEEKRTFVPPLEEKADISDNKSGHFVQEKADISGEIPSYVRRESTTEQQPEGKKEIAANAAPPVPPAVVVSEKPKRQRRQADPPSSEAPPQREPTEWALFLEAFCWVCYGHKEIGTLTEGKRGQLTSEGKVMRDKGYTTDDLKEWYKLVWGKGWQYKKDHDARPSPAEVRSTIAQLRARAPDGFEIAVTPTSSSNAANNRQVVANVVNRLKAQVNGHG